MPEMRRKNLRTCSPASNKSSRTWKTPSCRWKNFSTITRKACVWLKAAEIAWPTPNKKLKFSPGPLPPLQSRMPFRPKKPRRLRRRTRFGCSDITDKRLRRAANRRGDIGLCHRELRPEPRKSPDQVMRDENLSAAMGPRPDADGRNAQLDRDLAGQLRLDQLHDNCKSTGFLHRQRIPHQALLLGIGTALDFVASLF